MLSVKEINLLEAQNEGLKKQNAELQKENAILKEENYNKLIAWEEMQAENERLKKELKNNKSAYEVELGTYNMECGNLLEENKQLLQTLQEIKAIATGVRNYLEVPAPRDVRYEMDRILDLITKAESEVE